MQRPVPESTIEFDEVVHLAMVGGSFLRVPYLHATSEYGDQWRTPGIQSAIEPQIISIPAALRRSALTENHPTFRRMIFSSDLVGEMSDDRAAQHNQEAAGLVFKFHGDAIQNTARALLNERTRTFEESCLLLDKVIDSTMKPEDINFIHDETMPTGWLAFISRYWQDQRYVEPRLLMQHSMPLHFDLDLTLHLLVDADDGPQNVQVVAPIWGATGEVRCWDARLGEDTFDPDSGAPIQGTGGSTDTSGGTMTVGCDCYGLPYLLISILDTELPHVPLVIADESGQFFRRDVHVTNEYPQERLIALPTGRIGTPYRAQIHQDIEIGPTTGHLPAGVDVQDNVIEGIPEEYGANFFVEGRRISNGLNVCLFFAVNRWPCLLYSLCDTKGNDHHTGEYFACQYMPYGSMIHYGGQAIEFRRFASTGSPYPRVIEVPYVYGQPSRPGGIEAERNWVGT